MKIKTMKVINLKPNFLKENLDSKMPLTFCCASVLGIISGVVMQILSETLYNNCSSIYGSFLEINSSGSLFEILAGNFISNIVYVVFPMFFSLCAAGFAIMYIFPFIKGLGVGAICAYIYATYGISGIGYCFSIIFPTTLIQFFGIILSCNEGYHMASDILSVIRKENTAEEGIKINLFFLRYLIIIIIMFLGSLVYALCNRLYFNYSA